MKVKVNYKDIPPGTDLFVHGLPPLSNGAEIELSDDEVAYYKAVTGNKAVAVLVLDDQDRPSKHVDETTTATNPVEAETKDPADAGKKEGKA